MDVIPFKSRCATCVYVMQNRPLRLWFCGLNVSQTGKSFPIVDPDKKACEKYRLYYPFEGDK